MKIVGICKRCGKCCVYTDWVDASKDRLADTQEFYKVFFGEVELVCVNSGWALLRTNHRCRHLGVDNKCLIHKSKPTWCKEYPKRTIEPVVFKKIRPKTCGYTVVKEKT